MRKYRSYCLVAVAVLLAGLLNACTSPADLLGLPPGAGSFLATGVWGGPHIALTVTANGATYELDCAHGSIDGPLVLDAGGGLTAQGAFIQEQGGPVRPDVPPDTHPARYSGQSDGQTLTLTITLLDTGQDVGPYTAVLSQPARLIKCV